MFLQMPLTMRFIRGCLGEVDGQVVRLPLRRWILIDSPSDDGFPLVGPIVRLPEFDQLLDSAQY